MDNRNPLEVFGNRNETLRIEDSSIVHTDKRGQERKISIADIQKVQIVSIISLPGISTIGFITKHARKTIFGTNVDLVFYFQASSELPYAENIEKYIIEFQAKQG